MPDSGEKKLTVPKFSSFKPKAPPPAPSSRPSDAESNRDREGGGADEVTKGRRSRHDSRHHDDRSKRHRSEHHRERHSEHRSERRSEHRHHHRDRESSRSKEPLPVAETKEAPKSVSDQVGDGLFVIDKKGDPLIRRYGGNDRARVPLYRRGGRGRVLGSDGYLYIHRDGPREEFSIRMPGEGTSTIRDRALFQAKTHRVKTKRIRVRNHEEVGNEEDFVPLSNSVKRRRTEEPESSGDERPSYRSIEGKAKAHEFSDSDLDYDSETHEDDLNPSKDDPLKQRSILLSRRVKEQPDDIAGWLELINHQDVLLKAGESLDRNVTTGEVHSFAEIKISMYQSALAKAKRPEDEERLLLGLMLEGATAWSPSKLETRWADTIKKHGSSFCLWKANVDCQLANLTKFQYQNIRALHVDRLRAVAKQTPVSTSPAPGQRMEDSEVARYEQMIYVFLRATRFIYDAGYREMAVAAWQALFELNLQRPPVCENMPEAQILDTFRDFWEDETLRIGENGAPGWKHYVQVNGAVDPPGTQRDDDTVQQSRDVYKSWGATERLRASISRTPARATDDVLEDDPYRIVMFSDIEDLLFVIPTEAVSTIWKELVDGLLLFCCLPPAFRTSKWTEAAEDDPLIVGGLSLFESDVLEKPNEPDVMDESKRIPIFKQDGVRCSTSQDLLFAGPSWFSLLDGWAQTSKVHDGPVDLTWVANALRQLVTSGCRNELAEYCLAVDMVNDSKSTKKRAKTLIKRDPANLLLYNAYALAESAQGNADVARQVVSSATGLATSPNLGQGLNLWTTWAWMELEAGNNTKAVVRLCAAVDETLKNNTESTAATPTQAMRAFQMLLDSLEQQISTKKLDDAVATAEYLTLLVYLTAQEISEPTSEAQGSISAAMERLWTVSSDLCSQGLAKSHSHERLLQFGARLLYHHASRGPFRRVYLREQLTQCIEIFPRNTIFLTLFSWASTTFGVGDPVRETLRKTTLTTANDCISSRMFAIRYELQRGNVHSTQAAFERALETPACRANPELWRCYVRFSYARKQFRAKAKDVFFRGLRYCPWSKDLALEAYTTLVNVMDEFELTSLFNTMASKGLRMHVDLDEFVAKHKKGR
ncbi:NRDE2-like protein [Colletotrichum musicola]|uniref:NRDE2-like protein n=1 Tax=Colletotrichum musicola TaxID=2175873 RepID=A0A8H6KTC4_9PEZI|nr:NRDE2-like protein [Colletotrichum musicola]